MFYNAVKNLRDIPSDQSEYGGDSDSQMDDYEIIYISSESSQSSMEEDDTETPRSLKGKDGTQWNLTEANLATRGKKQFQNVKSFNPGPTSYCSTRIKDENHLSAFRVFFSESMMKNILKCTIAEAQKVNKNKQFVITLDELDKFIGLIITRGVIGGRNLPISHMWDKFWGCPLFNKTMPRDRFSEIMKYLRFDLKSERRKNLETDKFCLVSNLWNSFIENCQKAYIPHENITIDEQLLPCKARFKFIQYMANKPDKFGIKFWLAVDVDSKYLCNGFPYLGKDETRSPNDSVPTDVVLKLMSPFANRGYNLICDNYFTSMNLSQKLLQKKISIVGTIRLNRRELPEIIKEKKPLHDTLILKTSNNTTLTSYQCKKTKSVAILSTLHPDVIIPREYNPKKKPETVLFYNKNKVGVDVIDQMSRTYSTRAGSRRWPMHVFYNVLDFCLINAWIAYKSVCRSTISRRQFIHKVCEDLTGHFPLDEIPKDKNDEDPGPSETKKRRTCATTKCRNRTTDQCQTCNNSICGKCSIKKCKGCVLK